MILSGNEIAEQCRKGNIFIEDFDLARLGPNSYNLRLGKELLAYTEPILDPKHKNGYEELEIPEYGFLMTPGKIYLAQTMEYTKTDGFVPMLEGRSSVGRLGINIHATAGFGDVGFHGRWTLELSCVQPVKIYAGMEICQIYYHTIMGEIGQRYAGKYQESDGVRASQMWQDFEKKVRDITFCVNRECPFRDCERHICHLEGCDPNEVHSFAALDGTCRRYIGWLATWEGQE